MNQTPDLGHDLTMAVAKTLPPVAVWTLTLNDMLAAVSILYVLFQCLYLGFKWRRESVTRREDKAALAVLMKRPIAKPWDRAPKDIS